MNELSKLLREKDEGRWITTKSGYHIFIKSNSFLQKKFDAEMEKVLNKIPTEHMKLIKEIKIESFTKGFKESDLESLGLNKKDIKEFMAIGEAYGNYNAKNKEIKINKDKFIKKSDRLEWTVSHEIGHRINDALIKNDVIAWKEMIRKDKNYPTVYAKTNYREDFAESYAYKIMGKKLSQGRQSFMDKYVFKE